MQMQRPIPLATALAGVSIVLLFCGALPEYGNRVGPAYLLIGLLGLFLASIAICQSLRTNRIDHFLTQFDPLTGLANRRVLEATLASETGNVVLLLADLDDFKQINDTHGHLIGDEVLKRAAAELEKSAPACALTCRYGGEEFVVVLRDTELCDGAVAAEQLRESFAAKQLGAEKETPLTVSIGLATARQGETAHELIGRADAALYAAKRAGRDRVFFHDGTQVQPFIASP